MTTPLVITVISADKPGLVESLAQVINRSTLDLAPATKMLE